MRQLFDAALDYSESNPKPVTRDLTVVHEAHKKHHLLLAQPATQATRRRFAGASFDGHPPGFPMGTANVCSTNTYTKGDRMRAHAVRGERQRAKPRAKPCGQ